MDSEIVLFKAITETTAGCCFSTDYSCEFLVVVAAILLWFAIEMLQNIYNLHAIKMVKHHPCYGGHFCS